MDPALIVTGSTSGIPSNVLLAYQHAAQTDGDHRPGLPPALASARRHRQGRVRPRARRRARRQRSHPLADPGPRPVRRAVRRDPGHRRRSLGRRHRLGPRRRPDAVHPVVLAGARGRRERRRHRRPEQHLRRVAGRGRLPVHRASRPEPASSDLRSAVFGYNHSSAYVDTVLAWARAYASGGGLAIAPVSGGGVVLASGGGNNGTARPATITRRADSTPTPSTDANADRRPRRPARR